MTTSQQHTDYHDLTCTLSLAGFLTNHGYVICIMLPQNEITAYIAKTSTINSIEGYTWHILDKNDRNWGKMSELCAQSDSWWEYDESELQILLFLFLLRRIHRDNEVEGTSDDRRHPNELDQKLVNTKPHPKNCHSTQTATSIGIRNNTETEISYLTIILRS